MAQVNSYNVANRSGAQVREDINDIFSALKNCNSGGSDPSNPEKFMLYGDTGDDNLKIHDGSQFINIGKVTEVNLGLLPRSGGKMQGDGNNVAQIELDDSGTAAVPALSFDTDTDLGLFRKASNQMGFASGGTEQLFLDQNGITLNAQNEVRFGDSDSSNYVGIKAPSTVSSSNKTITLPDETGTLLTSASSIANSNLANSSVTVGSTAISLGASATTIAGLTTITSTNLQATNIKDTSGNNSSTPEQIALGRAKAYAQFDGTFNATEYTIANGGMRQAFNITSITDLSPDPGNNGRYRANFVSGTFTSANYIVAGTAGNFQSSTSSQTGIVPQGTRTTSQYEFKTVTGSTGGADKSEVNIVFFGD